MRAVTPLRLTLPQRPLRLPRLAFRASRSQPLDGHAHRFDRHHSLSVSQGFALQSQARRTIPPKRIRHPTGYAFASSCSPPRLRPRTAAQIPPSPCVERRSYFPLHVPGCSGFFSPGRFFMVSCWSQTRAAGVPSCARSTRQIRSAAPAASRTSGASRQPPLRPTLWLGQLENQSRLNRLAGRPAAHVDFVDPRLARAVDVRHPDEKAVRFPLDNECRVELKGVQHRRLNGQLLARSLHKPELVPVHHGDKDRTVLADSEILQKEALRELGDDGQLSLRDLWHCRCSLVRWSPP